MINIQDKANCCGCNACGDICPEKCIRFETDCEGFLYPVVDKSKCCNCHLCENICPILHHSELKNNNFEQPDCYAAESKNIEVIFDSTTGGLFSAFANECYKNNGFVGGAVFSKDFRTVKQIITNNRSDLKALRKSKYLQSNSEGFYNSVKNALELSVPVVVCGLPCQMAALRSFLRKDYENLLIIDLICFGVNSPLVWNKYLDYLEKLQNSKLKFIQFKSKEFGWRNLTQKSEYENGETVYFTSKTSKFNLGYKAGVYCRPSCYNCKFKEIPRISDVTLADFWGCEKLDISIDKNLGTSLVMINSMKGKFFFNKIQNKINYEKVPIDSIFKGNPALLNSIKMPSINRDIFFTELSKNGFESAINACIPNNSKSIKRKIKENIKFILLFARTTQFNPKAVFQTLKYSGIKNLLRKKAILCTPYCCINISRKAKIELNGILTIGKKIAFKNSKLETRFLLKDNSKLIIEGINSLAYGSDVEVFSNAELILRGNKNSHVTGTNINCTIICSNKIDIGHDVMIGRNVTIRDNNGGHYINIQGYKDSKPIIIKDKVWICEQACIMPGVTIGHGAIIGVRSTVMSNVPKYSLVSGTPAQVLYDNVLWKY